MRYEEDEVSKYIKKKKSSVSKSKEKSKHKHEYIDCLLIDNNKKLHKAVYCTICGKISNVKFCETEKTDCGIYRMLNIQEILKKYKNIPKIYVKDIFQKYVPIREEDDK